MFERFTRAARTVVTDAEAEARALGSATIEGEHLLLALTRTEPETPAASALARAGLDRDRILEALDAERERSLLAVGIAIGDFDVPVTPLPQRPRFAASAKTALEMSFRVSLARADRRIEPAHILLALLNAQAGTVPRALAQAQIGRAELRALTEKALDEAR